MPYNFCMDNIIIADKNEYVSDMLRRCMSNITVQRCDAEHVPEGTKLLFVNADSFSGIPLNSYSGSICIISLSGSIDCVEESMLARASDIFCSIEDIVSYVTENKSVWNKPYFKQARNQAELYLRYLGMSDRLCGFGYMSFLIAYMTFSREATLKYDIYPAMEKLFGKSESSIERAMRYAAEAAWNKGNIFAQQEVFGYSVSPERGKPVTRELAAMLSEKIREDMGI